MSVAFTNAGMAWAFSMIGKRIGRGECTDLVQLHLAYSGARPADFSNYRNYIWGAIPNGARPGDVIQFEFCKFRWTSGNSWGEIYMDHHTAIIVAINSNGLQLLHQNAPIGGPVKLETLNLNWKTQGTYRFWRPVKW